MSELLTDLRFGEDFSITPQGDFALIEGVDNVKQALLHRLLTTKGTLVHRPEYGVGIKNYLGAPLDFETQRQLAVQMQAQFLNDLRVAGVNTIQIEQDENNLFSVTIWANVEIEGEGEASLEIEIGEG
jgi:phage baseplate assembly protein W